MAEPTLIQVHLYKENPRVHVTMDGDSVRREEGKRVYWEGGRRLELDSSGPGDEKHVLAAIAEAYRGFRE